VAECGRGLVWPTGTTSAIPGYFYQRWRIQNGSQPRKKPPNQTRRDHTFIETLTLQPPTKLCPLQFIFVTGQTQHSLNVARWPYPDPFPFEFFVQSHRNRFTSFSSSPLPVNTCGFFLTIIGGAPIITDIDRRVLQKPSDSRIQSQPHPNSLSISCPLPATFRLLPGTEQAVCAARFCPRPTVSYR